MGSQSGLMNGFLLDTHVWIWLQEADPRLPRAAVHMIERAQAQHRVFASAISVLEIAQLLEKGRIELSYSIHAWLTQSFSDEGIRLLPLSPEIAVESTRLPGNLHRDPADRILTATTRIENLTLLTRDARLLEYGDAGNLRTERV